MDSARSYKHACLCFIMCGARLNVEADYQISRNAPHKSRIGKNRMTPMISRTFSSSSKRPFYLLLLAAFPVMWLGFYLGSIASGLGTPGEPLCIFVRALICAGPAVGFVLAAPRGWWLLAILHGYGFHAGYTFGDSLGAALATLMGAPVSALVGRRMAPPAGSCHMDLLWIFLFTTWITGFIYVLRRCWAGGECPMATSPN